MARAQNTRDDAKKPMPMRLSSSAFQNGERMPARHTADGPDLSPPLTWSAPPKGARSLALICLDPDAPRQPFVHWLLWNMPAEQRELPEDFIATDDQVIEGPNGFGTHGYAGPNPPPGTPHHYQFHLFALDTMLTLPDESTPSQLRKAMAGHVLGEAELVGRFGRERA